MGSRSRRCRFASLSGQKTVQLVLANNRDYWSAFDHALGASELERWHLEDHVLAESALTWGDLPDLFVTWRQPPNWLVRHISQVLGREPARQIVIGTGDDTDAAVRRLLVALADVGRPSQEIDVLAWGWSPVVSAFRELAVDRGWRVTPRHWPHRLESAAAYGRKDVFRSAFSELLAMVGTPMPKGVVVSDSAAVVEAARSLGLPLERALVKAPHGSGGWGIMPLSKVGRGGLGADSGIWGAGGLIVEERVEARCSPTVQAFVEPDGTCDVLMVGQQRLSEEFGYVGLENGRATWPGRVGAVLHSSCTAVGRALFEVGFSGWFDVDYVIGRDGSVYCLEANLRRTAVTALWELLRRGPRSRTIEARNIPADDALDERLDAVTPVDIHGPSGWIVVGSRWTDGSAPCAVWGESREDLRAQWMAARLALQRGHV